MGNSLRVDVGRDPSPPRARRGCRCGTGALILSALATSGSPAFAADEIHWTILGQNQVAFDWRGTETTLQYGTAPGSYSGAVSAFAPSSLPDSSPGPFMEVVIPGLAQNTLFYYRIGAGPEHTFRTPPLRGSSDFWFADEADVGNDGSCPAMAPTQDQISADEAQVPGDDRPRFVLVPGDLTYADHDSAGSVDLHFDDVQSWSVNAAYMPAWGNHEWTCTTCSSKPDNLNNYEGRFVLPHTREIPGAATAAGNGPADDWGWFDYGNVRFVSMPALDMPGALSDWQAAATPVMAQAQSDPAIRFIVAYGHFPAWSSGSDHGGDADIQSAFAALHSSCPKFTLAIHGHSHHYERSIPSSTGGVLNVVAGGGGKGCGGLQSAKPSWSFARANHVHHLKLHALPDRIECYAVCGPAGADGCTETCAQGDIIDHWNLYADGTVDVPGAVAERGGRDGVLYDVAGRRVEKPLPSGVYFERRGATRRVVVVRR